MTMFYIVVGTAVAFVVVMWLVLRSGHGYSVHDTEAHSTNFADTIKEGHGGLTLLLWVSFIAILAWTVFYLVQHWGEFSAIFAG
jgi:hypothetical protein